MKNQLEQLVKIYNSLLTVSTTGEDTITMAQCLLSFRNTIIGISQELQQEEK